MNDNELKIEEIKLMIYEVRGQQIMLDSDLAKLYGYETRRFNELVKNNINIFTEANRFQLTKNEANLNLMSKKSTSSWGGTRKLPYAFTLDGIKVLSTILRGPNVASSTSSIIEAFDNINNNTQILEKSLSEAKNGNLVRFESGDILLDVNVSPDEITVWLTQNDLAKLYETTIPNISMHLANIYESKELDKDSTIKKNLTVASNGKTYNMVYYNLEVVTSIGYRVNTKRGIEFRRWANEKLKQYLINGYAINTKRCLEHSDILVKLQNEISILTNKVIELIKSKESNDSTLNTLIEDIKEIKSNFIDPNTYKHFLIKDGEKIEADVAYQSIYKLANDSIIIIDDYIDVKTLQLLKICDPNIKITIITDNKGKNSINNNFINDFINDTGFNIDFIENNKQFHDRYIVIDLNTNYRLFHCGTSSKDSGKNINTIMEVPEKDIYIPLINKALNNNKLKI